MKTSDTIFFEAALKEAKKAAHKDEVPIGAVVVKNGEIISRAHNLTEKCGHFLAHAEMEAIKRAAKKLNSKFLYDCDLYVTIEPCLMCFTAAQLSRFKNIYFLARSEKFGRKGKAYFKVPVRKGKRSEALAQEATKVLGEFFKRKRLK